MGELHSDEEYRDSLKQELENMPPYTRQISTSLVVLAHAIELALNVRDRAVLTEMRTVTNDIFEQAEAALDGEVRNIQ